MPSGTVHFESVADIKDIVRRFESCQFLKGEFQHAHHLAVAAWYVRTLGSEQALERLRSGLLRLTSHFGVDRYHETITRFWLLVTEHFLKQAGPQASFAEVVNELVRACDKDLLFEYYSRERIDSAEAKSGWIEPDLEPLKFEAEQPSRTNGGRFRPSK